MTNNFITKIFNIVFLKSHAVVFCIFFPICKLNNQINLLLFFYTFYTIQCFNIYNTNSTNFNKMTCNTRCRTYQSMLINFTNFHNIIGNQTMSPANKFQSCFALSDTTFSNN